MRKVLIKKILADSLIKLSESIPLKKIKINDIVQDCGLSRQTFYNTFKDKDDLIAWTFERHFENPQEIFSDYNGFCKKTIKILNSNRKFYLQAYKNSDFLNWQEKWAYEHMYDYIIMHYGNSAMTDKIQYALESFVRGSYRTFQNRLSCSSKVNIDRLIENDMENMPEILRQFFPDRNKQ